VLSFTKRLPGKNFGIVYDRHQLDLSGYHGCNVLAPYKLKRVAKMRLFRNKSDGA